MPSQRKPDNRPADFRALTEMSAAFGQNIMHIQGAGGNVSLKDGDVMWIKASGTMLCDALTQDVFVPVDLPAMRTAIGRAAPEADTPAAFLIPGASTLRPSIETSLHAIFSERVVLHSHCIHTLAHAVQADPMGVLQGKLSAFDWAYAPYIKPGANLAKTVSDAMGKGTNVVVLGNHGLIVAGETVDAVHDLQNAVHAALFVAPTGTGAADMAQLTALCAGTSYAPVQDPMVHHIALTPERVSQVTSGSLYPDHVIFCGIAVKSVMPGDALEETAQHATDQGLPPPVFLLVPGAGLVARRDASPGAQIMLRCLADVIARVPQDAKLNYLTQAQNLELLDWDAEKYRQLLNEK